MKLSIARAADILLAGGIVAYPTEGVFGLGCLPDDLAAVHRLLTIKQRAASKGLILIASNRAQLCDWIDCDPAVIPDPDPTRPVTWIVPARPDTPALVKGDHAGIAIRLTTNPTAALLCDMTGSALVSTSANIAGQPVARNRYVLRRKFGSCIDSIVPGDCGPASSASEIRDLGTGMVFRSGAA
jgi:L-threonylcarbamoyladenylate synthase